MSLCYILQYFKTSTSKKITIHQRLRWRLTFFSNKVFLNYIPQTEEPERLQSPRSQRVGHDWLLYRLLPEDSISATRKVLVAYLCPTLCDPKDYSLPDSSVHGILQARILERVAISSSKGSSWFRDRNCVSHTDRWILYHCAIWKAHYLGMGKAYWRFYSEVTLLLVLKSSVIMPKKWP